MQWFTGNPPYSNLPYSLSSENVLRAGMPAQRARLVWWIVDDEVRVET